jgi:serine phosphatase RsbU (regulator of sigma subunit)
LQLKEKASAKEILSDLNSEFRKISKGNYSMTMEVIEIDLAAKKVRLINAGGPPVFVMKPDGKIKVVSVPGVPLGAEPKDFSCGEVEVDIAPGDRICAATDGIPEMTMKDGSMLKNKRFLGILGETKDMSKEEANKHISSRLAQLRDSRPLDDDMTFILMDYKELAEEATVQ